MLEASVKRYKKELLEEGAMQVKREVSLNLLKEGCEIDFISKMTGLSIEEVKKLASPE